MSAISSNTVSVIKNNQIGPWKLGETLGSGSTGKVLLASNETTKQQAAVKVISKAVFEAMNNSESNGDATNALPYNIEQEIIIMKLLNHPNVLRLFDVWETNSDLYLVLEYAEKGELFNMLVERGPLPENEAVRAFRQIIIGISYCHSLGVVHRDLKPENLLLDNKLNIKIADFGMAALESEDKLLETSCGSPHYAAPEIISGLPYEGFSSDVWSCGVILFALLTGRLPFDEEDGNIRNLLLKVQKGEFEMPDDDEITKEAQDLLARLLTVDPSKRITIREILKHPLLQKYPSIKDSRSIRNLPREDTYLSPLADTNSKIDDAILQNLVILWHGKDAREIAAKLREPGANTEKTLYALLYRFKCDTQREANRARRQSKIVQRNSTIRSTAPESPSKKKTYTPQKKNKRASIIASSSKRPVSVTKTATNITVNSSITGTPKSAKRMSMNNSARKRMSALYGTRDSPTKTSRSRRSSIITKDFLGNRPRDSVISMSHNKRASKSSKRISLVPNLIRQSVTTKLMATYAKLSEDDDWEYIERETKRTSSDFATLIDEIFEYEKYEQIRKEKAELERKVRETKEREERERKERQEKELQERLERERIEKQKEDIARQMDEEISNLKKELVGDQDNEDKFRSVSEPLESKSKKIEDIEEDIDGILRNRKYSLQTRPVSRLDPGIGFVDKPRQSEQHVPETVNLEPELEETEQKILETIRRSKFLGSSFDIKKELENVKRHRQTSQPIEKEMAPPALPETLPKAVEKKNVSMDPSLRKISDIKVPQFTRKSRHFSTSNRRLSVLSMYSTKESYSNLADILKNGPGEKEMIQTAPTPKSADDSDQLFDTIDEADTPASVSREERLYEVAEESENELANKKIDIADLLNSEGSNLKSVEEQEDSMKLPKLPPLFEDGSTKETKEQSKSMIPENMQSSESQKQIEKNNSDEGGSLNPFMTKHRDVPDKGATKEKPTVTMKTTSEQVSADKKRNMSFLRKLSKGSSSSKDNVDVTLSTSVSSKQLFSGLVNLLKGWTKYGLKGIAIDSTSQTITGKLANDNILSFRSTAFSILIFSQEKGSAVTFRKVSGSSKAVRRLSDEVKKVLSKEGVLRD